MRILAPTLLLLLASCGRGGPASSDIPAPGNDMGQATRDPAGPNIVIAATGPGNCSASWDGQPATPAQVTERSRALIEQAIARVGGVANMTEEVMPVANVRAPADMTMTCVETVLVALNRSGMASARLGPASGEGLALMDFPLDTGSPPPPLPMVMGLGAGGQVTWNNDPLDTAGLNARLGQMGSLEAPDPMEGGPPPGVFELQVAREATVGQLYGLLRTIGRYHIRPMVYLPSAAPAQDGPPMAVSPPLSAPPPPPVPPPPRPR